MKRTIMKSILSLALLAASAASAQTVISNETLVPNGTTLVVSKTPVTVDCNGTCSSQKPLFSPVSINCPDSTCTVHVALTIQFSDDGGQIYSKFLIDSAAPTPGPTDSSGFYPLFENVQGFINPPITSAPAAIVATVGSGTHSLQVSLACTGINNDNDGCGAVATSSTLRVDVFTP